MWNSLALALVATAMTPATAQEDGANYELAANGTVQIAPDGHVSDYRLESNLAPVVADLVRKSVMGWHFEPIVVEGKPVIAKTAMHLQLSAEPAKGKPGEFVVRVASMTFGSPRQTANTAPRYPMAAARARMMANVLLALRLDKDGNVLQAIPYRTSLNMKFPGENKAEFWRRMFEEASVASAKTWRFDMTESVGGVQMDGTAIVPIAFRVSRTGKSDPAQWQGFVDGPAHEIPWHTQARPDEDRIARLADSEALAMDSRFHLKDDVIGKAL